MSPNPINDNAPVERGAVQENKSQIKHCEFSAQIAGMQGGSA